MIGSCAKKERYKVLLKFILSRFGLVKKSFAEAVTTELEDELEFIRGRNSVPATGNSLGRVPVA